MKDSRPPPDPPGRVRTEGGESGDSEIEEVGRAYRHSSSREQGLASSSFDWGASSFTSTLDVDAIKVSESSGPTKAPLTTIAPDWEEAVLPPMPNLAAERTLPKLEPAVDSSSESESEGCSASDSESGSNEGSSSSSCSSLESDSSSENEEDSSKVPKYNIFSSFTTVFPRLTHPDSLARHEAAVEVELHEPQAELPVHLQVELLVHLQAELPVHLQAQAGTNVNLPHR